MGCGVRLRYRGVDVAGDLTLGIGGGDGVQTVGNTLLPVEVFGVRVGCGVRLRYRGVDVAGDLGGVRADGEVAPPRTTFGNLYRVARRIDQVGVRRVHSWRAGDGDADGLAGAREQVEGYAADTGGKVVVGFPGHFDGGDVAARDRPNGCDGVDAGNAGGINLDFEP